MKVRPSPTTLKKTLMETTRPLRTVAMPQMRTPSFTYLAWPVLAILNTKMRTGTVPLAYRMRSLQEEYIISRLHMVLALTPVTRTQTPIHLLKGTGRYMDPKEDVVISPFSAK